jgi:hypothetical protein
VTRKVDLKSTLVGWKPSDAAQPVTDPGEVSQVRQLLEHYAVNTDPVTIFGNAIEAKFEMIQDKITLSGVLDLASEQLKAHGLLWRTHPEETTDKLKFYEMPLVLVTANAIKYTKFEITLRDTNAGLVASNVVKFRLRYHKDKKNLAMKVKYEK